MFVTDSGRLTGKPEVTCSRFQADSDAVVQKSLSGDRKLISSKPVSGQPVNSDRLLDTSAFVGTNLENTANFCIASRSRGISAIVSGRLPQKPICGPRGEARI